MWVGMARLYLNDLRRKLPGAHLAGKRRPAELAGASRRAATKLERFRPVPAAFSVLYVY